jgi:hypothetical protein
MLGDAPAWLWLALLVTPGWFAVRGWHAGRNESLSTPLAEWVPLALAIGATWSGVLVLSGAARAAAIAVTDDQTAVRLAAWLAVACVLWLMPFGLGWVGGRRSSKQREGIVTVVLRSGATIAGTLQHATATELTLADVTVDARAYDSVTISRSDAELILHRRRPAAPAASAAPSAVRAEDGDLRTATRRSA